MNIELLRRVRAHFMHDMAPSHVARHNARQWVRSIRLLGDRWLLARPVRKETCDA